MKIAVYPGSFDPVTCGHMDVIERAAGVFDKVIVAVLNNSEKKATFTADERVEMIEKATEKFGNVESNVFSGLLVDFVRKVGANVIVKGLRAMTDFEQEFQQAHINKRMEPSCDTFFLPTKQMHSFLSSSVVREIARYNGDLTGLVPDEIREKVIDKLANL
jgi:pantetheine-phosphate adenylyltransferase